MISIKNYRPGVYSSYTVSSPYGTPRSKMPATIICQFEDSANSNFLTFKNYNDASLALSSYLSNKLPLLYCQLLFEAGVSAVNIVKTLGNPFDTLNITHNLNDIGLIIADFGASQCRAAKIWLSQQAENQNETIMFVGCNDPNDAFALAEELNSERIVVGNPSCKYEDETSPMFTACALAAKVLLENNPAYNFNSLDLPIVTDAKKTFEHDIQALMEAGVSIVENVGNGVECVRAITTRTKTEGAIDYSFRSLNTILIIDDVIKTIRNSLKRILKGSGFSSHSLDSVSSQVVIELATKKEQGLIEEYMLPKVSSSVEDPSVCIVDIAFNIAHIVSQIHITAHIGL